MKKPTMEILEQIKQNSKNNENEVFTRLYRYMLRPDLYYVAYSNLYANCGSATVGVDNDTADGFSEEKINKIIKSISDESYKPKPVRRTYIQKTNGKQRPLGIPTFTDKLVQEVLRMILEVVYEPIFLDCSHGFRPKRSCHTALNSLKKGFNGTRWFVEGDIKGCFDNIDHNNLISLINSKIKDVRLIKLLWKFLRAGYMENWKYYNTYSGTPQGGIISPLLSNIYLHELDKFAVKLAENFNQLPSRKFTKEYISLKCRRDKLKVKIKKTLCEEERQALIKEEQQFKVEMLKTPSKMQDDKKLKYIRYADDFLIGVNGSKEDCIKIKQQFSGFIAANLKMELSEEKTLITHSNSYARFLGYDVRVHRSNQLKKTGKFVARTLSNKIEMNIPFEDKIMKFLFNKEVIKQNTDGSIEHIHRKKLLNFTPLEIISTYNAELRGICNYYSLASNFNSLDYFAYLMEYSCLKTLANKHKSSTSKVISKYRDGKGKWGIPYSTKFGDRRMYFAKFMDCRETKYPKDEITNVYITFQNSRNTFEKKLMAKECELCGTTEAEKYELHHISKVKNLKGKKHWEQIMIAKRRKTLVACIPCHKEIHRYDQKPKKQN